MFPPVPLIVIYKERNFKSISNKQNYREKLWPTRLKKTHNAE